MVSMFRFAKRKVIKKEQRLSNVDAGQNAKQI